MTGVATFVKSFQRPNGFPESRVYQVCPPVEVHPHSYDHVKVSPIPKASGGLDEVMVFGLPRSEGGMFLKPDYTNLVPGKFRSKSPDGDLYQWALRSVGYEPKP